MGVYGLTRYCRQNEEQMSRKVSDLHHVTLAVDFIGFLYYLCDKLFHESNASASWLLFGGCTLRLERYVDTWIHNLQTRDINLIFITDPPQSFGGENHRKSLCLQDRADQKAQLIRELVKEINMTNKRNSTTMMDDDNNNSSTISDSSTTTTDCTTTTSTIKKTLLQTNGRFPFAREKLRGVLRKHGIPITTADREADEELGALIQNGKAFAVLGKDSDFFIMKGMKYIPFENLVVEEDEHHPDQVQVHARVFMSELVAQTLELREEQLVDLALLCGNDFTPLLDEEYGMATALGFPIQRLQTTSSFYPTEAARWVREHLAILDNPFLSQIEADKKGFLRALFEIYRFYGHTVAFLKKFPMRIKTNVPKNKLIRYKLLIDCYEYPPVAIDILEMQVCVLSQRFDPLSSVPGLEGKSLYEFQAPMRQLFYSALDTRVVQEATMDNTLHVRVTPLNCLQPFLSVQKRSEKAVERMFRSLVFQLLYDNPAGGTVQPSLAGMLGKTDARGLAIKNIVYSLLILWRQDCLYLADARLLDDRFLELLLLSSLISLEIDMSKEKMNSWDLVAFDKQLVSNEVYAVVFGYLETLKQLHQLWLVLRNKSSRKSGCATYFSGEVFVQVCKIMMQYGGKANKATNTTSKSCVSAFTRKEIELAIRSFAAISNVDRFWAHYKNVCAIMQRMKALIPLPAGILRVGQKKSTTLTMLEKAMTKDDVVDADNSKIPSVPPPPLPPTEFTPPLPPDTPPPPLNCPFVAATLADPFTPLLSPRSSLNMQASAPKQWYRRCSKTPMIPSSVAKLIATDNGMRESIAETKTEALNSVSLKGLMKTLPVFRHREEILNNVVENQLTIIQGETGCGKSTSVPQFLYDSWARDRAASERPVNIYVTQPRRIAAIELADTVAKMREENEFGEDGQVGQVIGYRIGQKQLISSKTKITYVTTGYMVERIVHDPDALKSITHLVLDEVHERSMDIDLLLLLLKLQLKDHPCLRLVIMSATMDAQILIKYFGKALSTQLVNKNPLFVGSKLFPVKNVYLEGLSNWFPSLLRRCVKAMVFMRDSFQDMSRERLSANSEKAKKTIPRIHELQLLVIEEMVRTLIENHHYQSGSQCILIFLPGIGSINSLFDALSTIAKDTGGQNVQVLVLHSGIELENQQQAFKLLGEMSTKIILSTNIAESSVTIPDVTHVINCAIEKQIEMPNAGHSHAEVLMNTWCSRASALQRSGRAGRVMPGTAFHLVTESFQDRCMAEYNIPELLRKPLDRVVLQLKGQLSEFGVPSCLLKQALDAPDISHISGAYKLLYSFDAIDSDKEDKSRLTRFGSFVCQMPLSLELCRLVMTGAYMVQDTTSSGESWPLLLNAVVLVAVLAVPDLFVMPSFYHAMSAQSYVKEMNKNLQAKLKLDNGMWSEPLSVWLFYIKIISEQPLKGKRNLSGIFRDTSISARRYQTLNFLISDLCARLIALSKSKSAELNQLLDTNTVIMLSKMDAYASSQRMDKQLRKFAQDTMTDKQNAVRVFRFLIVQNYSEHLIGSTRGKATKFADDGTDRVDLSVDKREAVKFLSLSNEEKATLFNQLARSANPMDELALLAYEHNTVSIHSYITPKDHDRNEHEENCFGEITRNTISRMSFPVSLVYYIRGEKFPVDLGMRPNPRAPEQAFKFRVSGSNANGLTWQQQKDNVKASTGSRSLFSLPIRPLEAKTKKGEKDAKLFAVYADRLFTGDETRMWCTNCTLLPPSSVCYYPIMLLATAPQHANIQLHIDANAGEILLVKVGAQDATLPLKMALKVDVLATVNVLRAALSDALNATIGATRIRVSDLLALTDDSVFLTKESKANVKDCKWQRLSMKKPDKTMLVKGETPTRFPMLHMA